MGTISHDRSLLQCGEDLVLVHHTALAQELFAQLAVQRFGGGSGVAQLSRVVTPDASGPTDNNGNSSDNVDHNTKNNASIPSQSIETSESESSSSNNNNFGIDIQAVVGAFVQFEEILQNNPNLKEPPPPSTLETSDSNKAMAEQVADCLLQHSKMLSEYFSIQIVADDCGHARLTGLPVLLEGYEPSRHGLSLFLLRLATEVDWSEEKPCFAGVCRELGAYYGQLSSEASTEQHAARLRHVLFPAISTLLVPTEQMVRADDSGSTRWSGPYFRTLTSLPKLYKVFERC